MIFGSSLPSIVLKFLTLFQEFGMHLSHSFYLGILFSCFYLNLFVALSFQLESTSKFLLPTLKDNGLPVQVTCCLGRSTCRCRPSGRRLGWSNCRWPVLSELWSWFFKRLSCFWCQILEDIGLPSNLCKELRCVASVRWVPGFFTAQESNFRGSCKYIWFINTLTPQSDLGGSMSQPFREFIAFSSQERYRSRYALPRYILKGGGCNDWTCWPLTGAWSTWPERTAQELYIAFSRPKPRSCWLIWFSLACFTLAKLGLCQTFLTQKP